jgi:hypothetical protein
MDPMVPAGYRRGSRGAGRRLLSKPNPRYRARKGCPDDRPWILRRGFIRGGVHVPGVAQM